MKRKSRKAVPIFILVAGVVVLGVAFALLLNEARHGGEKYGHTCGGTVIEKDVTDGRYWATVDCLSADSTVRKFNATLTQRQWNSTLAGGTWLRIEHGVVVEVDNHDSKGCLAIPVTLATPLVALGLLRNRRFVA